MAWSIAALREGGRKSLVIPHLFLLSALIGRQNFFPKVFLTRGSQAVFLQLAPVSSPSWFDGRRLRRLLTMRATPLAVV
jgi:hypothetical protein